MRRLLFIAGIWLAMWLLLPAASVKLRWNANPEPDIAGYRISYGESDFAETTETGNVTSHTLEGLRAGATYQFVLRAVNTAGLVSEPTEPITHTVAPAAYTITASSEETHGEDGRAVNAIDDDPRTLWHSRWTLNGVPGPEFWQTDWQAESEPPPHWLKLTWPQPVRFSGLRYLPRQDGEANGNLTAYALETSADGNAWQTVAEGSLQPGAAERVIVAAASGIRHARLTWKADRFGSAAELVPMFEAMPPVRLILQASEDLKQWRDLHELSVPCKEREFYRVKIER